MKEDDLDIIRKRVLMLAEEDTEEGKKWRNVVNAFMREEEEQKGAGDEREKQTKNVFTVGTHRQGNCGRGTEV